MSEWESVLSHTQRAAAAAAVASYAGSLAPTCTTHLRERTEELVLPCLFFERKRIVSHAPIETLCVANYQWRVAMASSRAPEKRPAVPSSQLLARHQRESAQDSRTLCRGVGPKHLRLANFRDPVRVPHLY